MLCLKKFIRNELFHLTILLSLLRFDPYFHVLHNNGYNEVQEIMLDSTSVAFMFRQLHSGLQSRAHPKNLENMILNQHDIFYDLNALGRYNRYQPYVPHEVTTYLLNGQEPMSAVTNNSEANVNGTATVEQGSRGPENGSAGQERSVEPQRLPVDQEVTQSEAAGSNTPLHDSSWGEMSKEDMDLIEILLRQDIDLGVTKDVFDVHLRKDIAVGEEAEKKTEPDKKLEAETEDEKEPHVYDPWFGLNYTIDCETGEHVLEDVAEAVSSDANSAEPSLNPSDLLILQGELDNISLEDLSLVSLPDNKDANDKEDKESSSADRDSGSEEADLDLPFFGRQDSFSEDLKELEEMIQSAQIHHPGRGLQPRVQYLRSMSMEQRWQDLSNFLSFPPSSEAEIHHHHHHHNMSMGMLHGAGHVAQHNYSISGYGGLDNRTSVLLQNATLPPPVADINSNMTYPGEVGSDPSNIGAAVVTSMSTLTSGNDSMADTAPHGHYQMDSGIMMFPSNHSEVNQTTEGFLSAILNDEDLQLMDMAMNEGMYTMRMLENDDAMDTSSDSAVSSMGSSERVPSISDGQEWMETASESSHPEEQDRYYGIDYNQSKFRQYNYSYAPGMAPSQRPNVSAAGGDNGATGIDRRMPPVAQKKYQLFGKRVGMEPPMGGATYGTLPRGNASMPQPTTPMKYPDYMYPGVQENNSSSSYGSLEGATAPNTSIVPTEPKYSCSVEFTRHAPIGPVASLGHIQHNHSYPLPANAVNDVHRPTVRDKTKKVVVSVDEHLPRDEKRARAMKIPIKVEDIINLPMDEFNERLSKYDLTEAQLALIRDIRRRGKNKVAAQNCRKRKLDQIILLADEVHNMLNERERLLQEQNSYLDERQRMKDKYSQLYRHVFQSLRDPDGNPYSPYDYSLQQAADGNILLVPRNGTANLELDPNKGAKSKRKEDDKK